MTERSFHPAGVASVERKAARRAFWLFLAVAIVCTAQVSWWSIIQIRDVERMARMRRELLDSERRQVAFELTTHYARLWHTLDSLTNRTEWAGAFPKALLNDPAVFVIGFRPPVKRTVLTPFGQVEMGPWTWSFRGIPDSTWVGLAPGYPADYLTRQAPRLEFTGDPPSPSLVPWNPIDPPLRIRAEASRQIEQDRNRALTMFISEGAFFVILIIAGAYLIYRSVRQSADLRRRQQNFIAAVTHELKAPLASVKLYAETLARPEITRAQQGEYLDRMLQDISRLEHLVDNTLMAGRLEQKGFHLKLQRTDFSRDLEEYVQSMRGFLERHRFELSCEIDPGIEAITDYDAMRRVVQSVVENAVKYSNSRPRAELRLRRDGRQARLTLRDYGVGIPAGEIERVFDAFYRVGDEMTRQIRGTGLGLYLAREIVAAHGGDVRMTSEGTNQGATITITLPVAS